MAPKWGDETNIKFVQLYRDQPCLWDQHNELYKDKYARHTALSEMVSKLNIQGFGVAEVKAKIKSLRGTFHIELAKQRRRAKYGYGSAGAYVPTLKWFNIMKEVVVKGTLTRKAKSALNSTPLRNAHEEDCKIYTHTTNTFDNETHTTNTYDLETHNTNTYDLKTNTTNTYHQDRATSSIQDNNSTFEGHSTQKEKQSISEHKEIINLACAYLTKTINDKYLDIAKVWAEKLRDLDKSQQILAEKSINDVLFEASLGNLQRNSVQINVTHFSCTNCPPSSQEVPFATSSQPMYKTDTPSPALS